ncbi:hypothetical protein NMY22_g17860 [Coprinellus aureogranulatus]|nr:hypothetical protein NMY22_g17860 [Coprinellus aureogranulatus]
MSSSTMTQGRTSRLPLSSVMRDLLRELMRAIDRRHSLFVTTSVAVEDDNLGKFVPVNCECCYGLGFVMVTPDEPPASPTPEGEEADEGVSAIAANDGNFAPATSATTPAVSVAPAAVSAPVLAPSMPATGQAVTHPALVPHARTPIPGLYSLGSGTAPPIPAEAIYCVEGATRYYTITRGLRVGVYEGWQNVAPYVVGVANASYSKHSTLMAAYQAYITTYDKTFVIYA